MILKQSGMKHKIWGEGGIELPHQTQLRSIRKESKLLVFS